MGQRNMSYTGPMLDVEPQQVHHHSEHGMVSYGAVTSFLQPYNTRTILPPARNFDPHYLPEHHGHLPYVITQYSGEHCNTFMIPSPSGGVFSVPVNSHLVHGGQSVQAVPTPWLDLYNQHTWNHSHGLPYLHGCINAGGIEAANMGLHESQIPAMSRNSMPLLHPRPVRPPHGSHNVYHPTPPRPPPLPPVQVQNMDIHLQLTSTSHRNHTGISSSNPFQNGIDSGPSSVPIPPPPPGLRDYEAHQRELTIGLTLGHHSIGHVRVLPQDELLALGEQIGSIDSGLSDDFISDHLRTRTFSNLEDLALGVEEPNLCVICQMEFDDQDKIGMLDCRHEYHEECIKKWLSVKNNCPICKSTALT